jgi:alkylation response protein AidB-like acyl-CoA dehydrogenase
VADPVNTAGRRGLPTREALSTLRSSDVVGAVVPVEYGGWGADAEEANRVVADVARTDPSLAIVLFQHLAVSARITQWGTPEQRGRLLPALASGALLAASAWSEAGAGANKKNLATTADRDEHGRWALSGVKSFVTGAGIADIYLVLAQTDQVADVATAYGAAGQTFYLVPANSPGLTVGAPFDLAGMRTSATGSVVLQACTVASDDVLGDLGAAPAIIASVRESGVTLGAVALGIATAAYDIAAVAVRKRGSAAGQVSRHQLVDMESRLEAIRGCIERAGRRVSADPGLTTLHSKLFASHEAEQMCRSAQLLLGSAGYAANHPINSLAADARAVALMGPTNDLCRELVSESWQR